MDNDCLKGVKILLDTAQAVVIGAGAGLSTAGGLVYSGERFLKYFGDFAQEYDIDNMYAGGFYPFETREERWGWWCRYVYYNRFVPPALEGHKLLLDLVKDKNYFVLTTNVDHQFQKAGFDRQRLFYTQGDYGRLQCSVPCCENTYSNEEIVTKMVEQQQGRFVPTELIPYCPKCGKALHMNLRKDNTFVEGPEWEAASLRYANFLEENKNKTVVFLELGVGYNTPGIIKYPFWKMTHQWQNAAFVSLNLEHPQRPPELDAKAVYLDGDILEMLRELTR